MTISYWCCGSIKVWIHDALVFLLRLYAKLGYLTIKQALPRGYLATTSLLQSNEFCVQAFGK